MIIFNDGSKSNNNEPDFAAKKILQLTKRVQELMSELQSIKSSTRGNYESQKVINCFNEKKQQNKF